MIHILMQFRFLENRKPHSWQGFLKIHYNAGQYLFIGMSIFKGVSIFI